MIDLENYCSARAVLREQRDNASDEATYLDQVWAARDRRQGPVKPPAPKGNGWPFMRSMGLVARSEACRQTLTAVAQKLERPRPHLVKGVKQ